MISADKNRPVLFFDGVCNLCNGIVKLIVRSDRKDIFMFAALQSAAGDEIKPKLEKRGIVPDTVVLLYKSRLYIKSDAALKTAQLLGGWWRLLLIGYIFPRSVRNAMYDFVSRNRYKWFGKKDSCMLPSPELQSRFLS